MGKIALIIMLLISFGNSSVAQSIDELKPGEYFNFWIGEWDLTWEGSDGTMDTGKNTIERILNDKVIKENFEATSGQMAGYIGKSYSVYNPQTGQWKQTWVDNNGAYLDFIGKLEGEKRMFLRKIKDQNGEDLIQRMVFYDIKKNSFMWDWEKSTDDGKTWQLLWKIAYRRVQ